MPMRALEIVKTMRASKKRPHEWAKEVLGKCVPNMGPSQGEASVIFAAGNFKIRYARFEKRFSIRLTIQLIGFRCQGERNLTFDL